MSPVSSIALTVTGKQAALKDSSPTVRLSCNLENRGPQWNTLAVTETD